MPGLLAAFGALLCWGVADFLIQRSTRRVGIVHTLFFISTIGTVVLLPFIKPDLPLLATNSNHLLLLFLAGLVMFFAALFDFEALKTGKISIVEPIYGAEIPLTILLSVALAQEHLSIFQTLIIIAVITGIILTVTTSPNPKHKIKHLFEKGVALAGIGAIGMALTNFLVGISSQATSPLLTIWAINLLSFILLLIYLLARSEFSQILSDIKRYPQLVLSQSILDTLAWVFFAFATVSIPISIATTISESYIVLAVILGLVISHEKIKTHQKFGILLTFTSLILLSLSLG